MGLSCKVGRGKLLISSLLSQGVGREKAPVLLCTAHFIILYGLQLGGGVGAMKAVLLREAAEQ